MTDRKQIPDKVIAELLVATRRRCCLCYYLDNNKSRRKVQIAHIDQKRNNNNITNLVPLCLDHHDEYDSSTSQSKGITKDELSTYKTKLINEFREIDKRSEETIVIEERDIPNLSTELYYGYGILFGKITRILFKHDPMNINFEFNNDEYDPEAHDIIGKLQNNTLCLSTAKICHIVFSNWFSESLAGKTNDYSKISKEIDKAWVQFKQRNYVYSG